MLVTAVITTYKRSPNLVERALKSVLSQSYKNIETIVVDDSPTNYELRNDVRTMIEKYKDSNVKYIALPKNSGPCAARNMGLKHAKGKYIGFLDDDDEWMPTKIEEQLKLFIAEPDLGLVYCGVRVLHEDTKKTKDIINHKQTIVTNNNLLKFGNFIGSTSFPLIETKALRNIEGFDIKLSSAEDYDVWLRLSARYKVGYVSKVLGLYHIHSNEQLNANFKKKTLSIKRIIRKNIHCLNKNTTLKAAIRVRLIESYINNKNLKLAFYYWYYAITNNPFDISNNLKALRKLLKACLKR